MNIQDAAKKLRINTIITLISIAYIKLKFYKTFKYLNPDTIYTKFL